MVTRDERRTDGGQEAGLDAQTQYYIVRKAVEDAILNVIGTLLLLGVAFFVMWVGVVVAFSADAPFAMGLGVAILAFGLYLGAATLDVIPPVRAWF